MNTKVYLAGKITDTSWRQDMLGEQGNVITLDPNKEFGSYESFPVVRNVLEAAGESFDYCGPYFVDADQSHSGTLVAPESHGITDDPDAAAVVFDVDLNLIEHCPVESLQVQVYRMCRMAIWDADIVFAWIDRHDIYGTIAELGMAVGMAHAGKQVWIGHPDEFDTKELWFVDHLAHAVCFAETPLQAFQSIAASRIQLLLRNMPYEDYLQTNHWQRLREQAHEYAEGRCQLCNDDENLHVHHRSYERRGAERPSDLTVLCAECHAHFHQIVNGRPTKMPVRAA